MAETEASIPASTTHVFTGYIFDADGAISFMESIDDHVRLWIDGVLVLNDGSWNVQTATPNLALTPGWHEFELRLGNGSGPGGANGSIGFGYDPDGGANWVHPEDNGSGNLFSTTLPTQPVAQFQFVSDLIETSSTNGWGPIEKNTSNGEASAGDGVTMTINGVTYSKGLGVHADSTVEYTIVAGEYDQFTAEIGIDDEVGNNGTVTFEVWLDGVIAFSSSELTGADSALSVSIPIGNQVTQVELRANQGSGNGYDHANWADAKFRLTTN
jgi:hypothetical protein